MSQTTPAVPRSAAGRRGTVVILSSIYWGVAWQRHQQLATEFARRGYQVYFVHPLSGRWRTNTGSIVRRAINRLTNPQANFPRQIAHPIAEGIEIVRPAGVPDQYWPAEQFNRRIAIPRLVRELRQRGLPRPIITINTFPLPHTLALQEALAPDVSIYDAVWDFAHAPGGQDIQWNEPELAATVDLIFADSPGNFNRTRTLSDRVIRMPHGVDTAMFEQAYTGKRPDPDHIRCAYFGSIDQRIDIALLRELSRRHPLRLIGPVSVDLAGFADDTEILGPAAPDELPGLLRDVDVLLLPYVAGEYIDAILPAKTFECLATGKPTVSIGLSSLEEYREYFYLCDDYEEVFTAIDTATQEDSAQAERRIALARENSWDRRVDQMIWQIDQVLAERRQQPPSTARLGPMPAESGGMTNQRHDSGAVVIVSSIHWNHIRHPHHQIASGLAARGYQVCFVEPLPTRWWPGAGRLLQHIRSRMTGAPMVAESMVQPAPDGVEIIQATGTPEKYPPGIWFNAKVTMPRLVRTLRQRGLPRPLTLIHFVPLPYGLTLQEKLAPDAALYYAIWDFQNDPSGRGVAWSEPELVAAVDQVLADSPYHLERMAKLQSNVRELLPAVDEPFLARAQTSTAVGQGNLICAYYGAIDQRLDIELLREVSRRYTLRLIGPVSIDLDGFSPRTQFHGPVSHRDLPGTLADVDVLLLPYLHERYIDAIIPAKTFEYLATGKPAVVSGLSSLERYSDYFYLCDSQDEFLAAIEQAVHEDPILPEQRLALARENSWERRIDELIEVIDSSITEERSTPVPRVAYLSPSFHPYRAPVFEALNQKLGGQLAVVTLEEAATRNDEFGLAAGDFPKMLVSGRRIDLLRHQQRGAGTALGIMLTPRFPMQLRRLDPQIVISNNFNLWTMTSLLSGYRTIIFWEGTDHTERTVSGPRLRLRRWMARLARGFVVNGELSRRYLVDRLGVDDRNITAGGLSAEPMPAGLTSRALDDRSAGDPVRFLFVGRLIELKGVHHLIEAFASLDRRGEETHRAELLLVGDGPERAALEARVAGLGLQDSVTFVGYVTPDEVWHYYQQADVFVLPTLQDNWPLVVAEAMAVGMPVLLSVYAGSVPDLIDEGENGFAFDPEDHEGMAELMNGYLQHPDQIARQGRRSQQIVARYTPEHAAGAFYQAIANVIAEDRASQP